LRINGIKRVRQLKEWQEYDKTVETEYIRMDEETSSLDALGLINSGNMDGHRVNSKVKSILFGKALHGWKVEVGHRDGTMKADNDCLNRIEAWRSEKEKRESGN